ncbi:MAG: tRNA (adenosine(37)-N6)-dimethylallyltransferase MiaA, partial [Deltaproteobacteria bacterium]|nr:tRNA (adenosine(37)-N6)-dimethylallyltransferase MiaA [Deltaproteobacteria bacterium]
VEPSDRFSAARFVALADPTLDAIIARSRLPIVVGGTGLYVRALFHGLFPTPKADPALRRRLKEERDRLGTPALHQRLVKVDPESAERLAPNDFVRISRALEIYEQVGRPASELRRAHAFRGWRRPALLLGLRLAPEVLKARIDMRVDGMLARGWLREVEELCEAGYGESHPMGALGYRQLAAHARGDLSYEEAVRLTKRDTRRFARRQRNWFSQEDGVIWYEEPFDAIRGDALRGRLDAVAEDFGR